MKKTMRRFFTTMIAVVVLCAVSLSASARYSEYIMAYYAALNSDSSGNLSVYVDLHATGVMTRIGAEKVRIYEKNGTYYTCVKTFDSDDYPNMITSSNRYTKNAVSYKGTPGKYYYAVVTLVAENSSGGDTRTFTTSIIKAG